MIPHPTFVRRGGHGALSLLPLLMVVLIPWTAAQADEAECNSYAAAAVATVAAANAHNCNLTGPRWTDNYQDHFNACMGWGKDPINGGMNALNELLGRAYEYGACLARQAQVQPPFSAAAFKGDDKPDLDTFCGGYGYIASVQVGAASNAKCGYTGARWDNDPKHHHDACMGFSGTIVANEINARSQDLVECEKRLAAAANGGGGGTPNGGDGGGTPNGGGQTAVSPNGTWVYKKPNGDDSAKNHAAEVPPGGQVTIVQCGNPQGWCQVSQPAAGYVWGADVNR